MKLRLRLLVAGAHQASARLARCRPPTTGLVPRPGAHRTLRGPADDARYLRPHRRRYLTTRSSRASSFVATRAAPAGRSACRQSRPPTPTANTSHHHALARRHRSRYESEEIGYDPNLKGPKPVGYRGLADLFITSVQKRHEGATGFPSAVLLRSSAKPADLWLVRPQRRQHGGAVLRHAGRLKFEIMPPYKGRREHRRRRRQPHRLCDTHRHPGVGPRCAAARANGLAVSADQRLQGLSMCRPARSSATTLSPQLFSAGRARSFPPTSCARSTAR